MKTKKLPNGFEIPILGIGTAGLGEISGHGADYDHDKENINAIKESIRLGYTHIDTAELYGQGHSEELIARAIKDTNRKKLFITTKVYKTNLKYDDLIKAAKSSLRRLKCKYIDLFLIHAPNPDIPIKETMEAMDYLIKNKIIKNIGVSNFYIDELKEAQKYTKNKIVVNQLKYNLWAKKIDIKTIKYCQKNNIIIIAHKPFGRGKILTDKIKLLSDLVKKYNKTEAQIVLNWLILKKNIVTIFKAGDPKHLRENLASLDFKITKVDAAKIDKLVHF